MTVAVGPGEAGQETECPEGLNTVTLIIQNIKNKKLLIF